MGLLRPSWSPTPCAERTRMPLKIKKIPLSDILAKLPLPDDMLKPYLATRPDVLDKTDIFYENSRSANHKLKNFDLFIETDSDGPDTIYICPVYLELYEFAFNNSTIIRQVIDTISKQYHSNKVVFQWNHDKDFAVIEPQNSDIWHRPDNAYIINFNTSIPHPNDIIVPFWVINTDWVEEEKKYTAGFIGSINNGLRRELAYTISGKDGYIFRSGLPWDEFSKLSSQCLFSLCPKGQGLSSYRFYESFHLNTVPVLFADNVTLPFEDEINYSQVCLPIAESTAHDFKDLDGIIRAHTPSWSKTIENIKSVRHKFSLLGVQEEIHRRLY
jgi:hypothetical protein